MKKGLYFVLLATLLISACGLKKEKELAERFALRVGATGYEVDDSSFFEKKEDHSALVIFIKEPPLKSPEMDPVYLSGKTAAAFTDSLGPEAANYEYFIMKMSLKGLVHTKRYKMKTLLDAKNYYKQAEGFVRALDKSDTTTLKKELKADVLSLYAIVEVLIAADNQKFQFGDISGVTILGFEETQTEATGRAVMNIRLAVYRQNLIAEVYNIAFDKADKKVVGLNWQILTSQPQQ